MSADTVANIKAKINEVVAKVPVIDKQLTLLADRVKVEKPFVALAVGALPMLFLLWLGCGNFLLDTVGFLYPAYCTIKVIESKDKEDSVQWLTYWLVFGLFKLVESVAEDLLNLIPFFFFIKLALFVYLFYPTTQGAKVFYENVIKVHLVPHLGLHSSPAKKVD